MFPEIHLRNSSPHYSPEETSHAGSKQAPPLGNLIPSTKLHPSQPHSKSKWANLERREQIKSLHRNGTIEKKLPERFSRGGEGRDSTSTLPPSPFLCQSPFKS
ncbi:hypothetical protein TNIN_186361 [Trichonephila inaurata madagascariensis]|uniref:Uncharacterized protein n=1 Tax=Trichonephila inaurata madagascariensis TaxID=2747483 RepID=A0A8X6XHB5_9ARAC|nr:hypothetical protein TNIN_186361 [Trichonephila inaurata madagascariensis]